MSAPRSRTFTGIAPADCAPSTSTSAPRSWAISAIRATGITRPLVHSTCEIETSFVPGVINRSNWATISSSDASPTNSAKARSTPNRSHTMYSGPTPPACSWHVVTARPPSRQSMAHVPMFMPSVAAWVSATSSRSPPRTAATPARASSIALQRFQPVLGLGAPEVALVGLELGHRGRGLGRDRAAGPGIELDGGGEGRQRGAHRRELVRVGHERGDHQPMIST